MAKKQTLFTEAKHKYLADIISFKNPQKAKGSVIELLNEFQDAGRVKKLRIARATLQASNRAKATLNRRNLSAKERKEFTDIAQIYKTASEYMFKEYEGY